ncbi:MAG: GIY-YIG nuclease family protein [Gammaproteobacteria bacterium]
MKVSDDLYFAICEHTSRIKIGRSADPARRLKQLQAASPTPLRMENIEGAGDIEPVLHRQFAHIRLHNEWFKAQSEMVDLLNGLLNPAQAYEGVHPAFLGIDHFYVVGDRVVLAKDLDRETLGRINGDLEAAVKAAECRWYRVKRSYSALMYYSHGADMTDGEVKLGNLSKALVDSMTAPAYKRNDDLSVVE